MEAGKTYVYKSERSRRAFLDRHSSNASIDTDSKGEFCVDRIDSCGDAIILNCNYIYSQEFKYFKLKENKMLKPDDMINVEMTALDGMMLFPLVGKIRDAGDLYSQLEGILGVSDSFSQSINESYCLDWRNTTVLAKAALAQFKDPKQDKIDELEATIKNAAEELDKIKAGDL